MRAGAFFIVRGNKAIRPIVQKARDLRGRRLRQLEGKPLSCEALPARSVDVEFVYLHTNLARAEFSAGEVGQLYRLRWQVELLFKECKSHANLHRFATEKSAIAEGLIWASMLAARCHS